MLQDREGRVPDPGARRAGEELYVSSLGVVFCYVGVGEVDFNCTIVFLVVVKEFVQFFALSPQLILFP